jgi:hypothetical protein
MNANIYRWVESIKPLLPKRGKVLEIGSLNVNGSVRPLFSGYDYLGIDIQAGQDVDLVMNGNDIGKTWHHEFEIVIACSVFEHDPFWFKTLDGIKEVIVPHGAFICSVPDFGFSLHSYPFDYYRFSEAAVRDVVMHGFDILDFQSINTKVVDGKPVNLTWNAVGIAI